MNETDYYKQLRHSYGYVRWSSEKQEEGDTERRQTELINNTAQKLKLPLISVYTDRGISALTGKNLKEQWAVLKNTIKAGDVILVENTDRITRMDLHTLFNELKEVVDKGAFVYTTANGVLLHKGNYCRDLNTMFAGTVSITESDKRIGRVREAAATHRKALLSGEFSLGARLPFWITHNNKEFLINTDKVGVAKLIFDLCLKGNSLRGIAIKLNKDGVLPPMKHNRGWSASSIAVVLRNRAAIGYWAPMLPVERITKKGDRKYVRYAKQDDKEVKLFTPIVSEKDFYAAQSLLNQRTKERGPVGNEIGLFKGLLICSICGQHFTRHLDTRKGHPSYYRCCGSTKGLCRYNAIRCDRFDRSIQFILSKEEIVRKYLKEGSVSPFRLDALKGELDAIKRKEEKLSKLITDDPEPSENLLKSLKELENTDRRLCKEIAVEEAVVRGSTPVLSAIKDYREKLMEKWNDPDGRLRIRDIIKRVIAKIIIDKEHQSYEVWFTGADTPCRVMLGKDNQVWISNTNDPLQPTAYHYSADEWFDKGEKVDVMPPPGWSGRKWNTKKNPLPVKEVSMNKCLIDDKKPII